jgi:nitric oxide reductase subunit B
MHATANRATVLGTVVVSLGLLACPARAADAALGSYPDVRSGNATLYTAAEIMAGQRALREAGSQKDWTADWRRQETLAYREMRSEALYGHDYARLDAPRQAAVDAAVADELRRNTYDAATNTIQVSPERATAIAEAERHYLFLFGDAAGYDGLRSEYGMRANVLPRLKDRKALSAYFFWSAWAASTDAPGRKAP